MKTCATSLLGVALSAALLAGCTSFDYPLLRRHVLPTDENGRVVDVESKRALADAEVDALIAALLQQAERGAAVQAMRSGTRELLIHIHGGLNPATASLATAQDALRRMQRDGDAPHSIFITWPSGGLSTYSDHLLRVRQGERWSRWVGWPTAPFILVSDLASSVAAAPKTLLYQWAVDARVAANVAFGWNLDRALADEGPLADAAVDAKYHVKRGTYARGFWNQTSRFFSYWLSQPTKVLFQLLCLNGMGQGAWDVMLHRTRHLFHGPDEYALSHDERVDPAARAAHVEGKKKRLHAFFDALAEQTCSAAPGAATCWDITLVGHSMGAIVVNEVLSTYPDLPVKNIVYMAPACAVRDAQKVIVPYLKRHPSARFFLLTLHPIAEADEKYSVLPWYDLLPRGSLLEWIDNWYTSPASAIDRTLGKWLNVIPAIWLFEEVRDRVYIKSFDTGDGGQPEKHGDFNDFAFWRPEFWWDESVGR